MDLGDRSYKNVPVAPRGDLMNYTQQLLVSTRSAATNNGWLSVLVMVLVAFACTGGTMMYGLLRWQPVTVDVSKVAAEHVASGNAFFQAGDYDLAIGQYTEAIEEQPSDAQSYILRGDAYRARGNTDKAVADFRQVLSLGQDQGQIRAAQKALQDLQSP